jgi:hypothetical protein
VENRGCRDDVEYLIAKRIVPAGYKLTKIIELGANPESNKYEALVFALNDKNIVYRKRRVTLGRPSAFLSASIFSKY